jgi:hypothetical protein
MKYIKIVLTVIAFLLAVQVAARIIPGARAGGAMDVNITKVGGKDINISTPAYGGIPVVVRK